MTKNENLAIWNGRNPFKIILLGSTYFSEMKTKVDYVNKLDIAIPITFNSFQLTHFII